VRLLLVLAATLALAVPATAGTSAAKLRVDRPDKGVGARVTTVRLLKGSVAHRTSATVLTDTRCAADMVGVSHCLNRMRLANGRVVLAQHDHRMAEMPCLSPGEHVVLTPA
jgi:hypothetical protein